MQLHVLVLHRTVILYKPWQTSKPPLDRHVLSATHRFVSGFRDRRGKGELELADYSFYVSLQLHPSVRHHSGSGLLPD